VSNINNNVIAQLIKLNVMEIINVYQKINNIYVNKFHKLHVKEIIHTYVAMDNVDKLLMIVQLNQFVHHNSHYVLI
jgi:hypothetical protein